MRKSPVAKNATPPFGRKGEGGWTERGIECERVNDEADTGSAEREDEGGVFCLAEKKYSDEGCDCTPGGSAQFGI